jgi:hypothetical protein
MALACFLKYLRCRVDYEPFGSQPPIGSAWGVEGRIPLFLAGIAHGSALMGGAILNQDRTIRHRCAVNPPIIVRTRRTHERKT